MHGYMIIPLKKIHVIFEILSNAEKIFVMKQIA